MPSRSLVVVSALLFSSSLLGCSAKPPAPPPPPAVTAAPVLQRDIAEWDEFSGRLEAVDQVEIRPRVSGYIKRVTFTEGREVRKGEVLFEIDPREYQAALERAQAQLEQARTAADLAAAGGGPRREAGERAGHLPRGVRQPDQRPGQQRRGRAGRGGRGRDRAARPRLDRRPLADRRPGEPRGGDRGQSGAVRAARRDPAHDGGLARFHVPLLRQRRADLPALLRPRGRRGQSGLARRALPGLSRSGQRDRLPPRGTSGLRGQPDRPRQRHHPHPRDLHQPRPPVHAGPLRPGEAGRQ